MPVPTEQRKYELFFSPVALVNDKFYVWDGDPNTYEHAVPIGTLWRVNETELGTEWRFEPTVLLPVWDRQDADRQIMEFIGSWHGRLLP